MVHLFSSASFKAFNTNLVNSNYDFCVVIRNQDNGKPELQGNGEMAFKYLKHF